MFRRHCDPDWFAVKVVGRSHNNFNNIRSFGEYVVWSNIHNRAKLTRMCQYKIAKLDVLNRFVAVCRINIDSRTDEAFHHIGNKHVLTPQPDLGQQLFQQTSGLPDKRPALQILVAAGRLADEHNLGVDRPFAGDRTCTALVQRTRRTAIHFVCYLL